MRKLTRLSAIVSVVSLFTGELSAQSVHVPGTNVTLAPPDGFSLAQHYPGFERADLQASIMVTEMPGPAADMIEAMTKPALASRGLALLSARDVLIKSTPARLLHIRQTTTTADVLKWTLITGDAKTTLMIVGTFPVNASTDISEAIQQSLLTASWGSTTAANPFEGLPFRMAPSNQLKLAKRVSNMLMFTESGTVGSPGSSEALYIAGHSLGSGQIGDVRVFSESRARQTTLLTGVTNFAGRPLRLSGLDAFELEADATDAGSGQAMRLYQVIIPDETGYFILQGLCRATSARAIIPEFKALTASFQIISGQ